MKDKVIIGISGAEFGVRCHVTAYDINSGKKVWRAYSMGPDSDILVDPEKTISLGKPVGKNSSLKTWNGDQWKIGGGSTWGYMAYDPELNLIYYGTGNPSTWNPAQRAGPDGKPIDQKWSMTMFARDLDTGIAKWAYQMTPFDEWDYDGINEPILAELDFGGTKRKTATHFDRNGFGYTWDRATGELLVAQKYDPAVNWATGVDMDKTQPDVRPSVRVVTKYSTFAGGADHQHEGHLPCGSRLEGRAAGFIFEADRFVLRSDEPRVHGLRTLQGFVYGWSALRWRHAFHVPGSGQPRRYG